MELMGSASCYGRSIVGTSGTDEFRSDEVPLSSA
jgi:hypothetical protein